MTTNYKQQQQQQVEIVRGHEHNKLIDFKKIKVDYFVKIPLSQLNDIKKDKDSVHFIIGYTPTDQTYTYITDTDKNDFYYEIKSEVKV